jgi:hypothetical protein
MTAPLLVVDLVPVEADRVESREVVRGLDTEMPEVIDIISGRAAMLRCGRRERLPSSDTMTKG